MVDNKQIKSLTRLLIGHGALLVFVGGIIGFAFAFFLIGKITVWPLPWVIEYQLPGTSSSWRMAHMEAILNGFILWIMAAVLAHIPLSIKGLKRATYGMLILAWTFVSASLIDPLFPDSPGLEVTNVITNNIAFGLFLIGIVVIMTVMAVIAYRSLLTKD